ncbi:Kinesin-related motor protein [Cryptotrichosporon argae]
MASNPPKRTFKSFGRSSQEIAQASPVITTTGGPLSKAITIETTPMVGGVPAFTTASSYGGSHAPSTRTYPFDKVFGPEADQTMVFREVVESMLDEVLAGYNCTIFAYGQTGTGKTYTMQGDVGLTPLQAPSTEAGIIPRVLHRLFHLLNSSPNSEYSVKCSYIELYNEELRDLLAPEYKESTSQPMALSSGGRDAGGLKIYEDGSKKGVMIQGLEETGVRNLKEGLALLNRGSQRRQVAETKMNTESSRSHSIFTLTVHVKETSVAGNEDMLRIGKFNLVDLAGSEAIGRSGAQDKRAREAGMINQSLLTLGRVISALVEKGNHIPYRESKLTRLLQDSLGGRTKTCIVATVSPTRSNMEETISTLDYAIRARSIRNKPEVNAHLTKAGLLKEYIGDIERLKAELQATREKNGVYIPEDQWKEMQDVNFRQRSDHDEAKQKVAAIAVELATRKQEFEDLTKRFVDTSAELETSHEAERQLGVELAEFKIKLDEAMIKLEEETVVSLAYQQGEEKLAQVAGGLKAIANESVRDIGGLFEKIARKAKVLGANADAATQFGADLASVSGDLRQALVLLDNEQAGYSQILRADLEAYAQRHAKESDVQLARLDSSFKAVNDLAKSLAKSVEKGKVESASAAASIVAIKDDVEQSSKHLDVVGTVMDSTAELVETVITQAQTHISEEIAISKAALHLVQTTATDEMARLKTQNALLARLLAQERANSQRLRSELVGNITTMIMGFTDAQDASLEQAFAEVQNANDAGVDGLDAFVRMYEASAETASQRRSVFQAGLNADTGAVKRQKLSGQQVSC